MVLVYLLIITNLLNIVLSYNIPFSSYKYILRKNSFPLLDKIEPLEISKIDKLYLKNSLLYLLNENLNPIIADNLEDHLDDSLDKYTTFYLTDKNIFVNTFLCNILEKQPDLGKKETFLLTQYLDIVHSLKFGNISKDLISINKPKLLSSKQRLNIRYYIKYLEEKEKFNSSTASTLFDENNKFDARLWHYAQDILDSLIMRPTFLRDFYFSNKLKKSPKVLLNTLIYKALGYKFECINYGFKKSILNCSFQDIFSKFEENHLKLMVLLDNILLEKGRKNEDMCSGESKTGDDEYATVRRSLDPNIIVKISLIKILLDNDFLDPGFFS